ncbi:hypothetical protein EYR36_004918 [Pleurotus pulmonarius]|nr:hypothetical protein EYR36_004918 [Pleurotus pulmonarius]
MSNPANSSNELTGRMHTANANTHGVTAVLQAPKAGKRKRAGSHSREEGEIDGAGERQTQVNTQSDVDMTDRSSAGQTPRPPQPTQAQPPQPTHAPQATPPAQPPLTNPHTQSSRSGLPPLEPTASRIAYTRATYPKVIKSLDALLQGIKDTAAEAARANPDKYVALLIYGGGNKVKEENPSLADDIEAFLKGLAIEGNEGLRIIDPPKQDVNNHGEFSKPHILLLQHASPELRAYILWYQTFAFQVEGRKIAFSALKLDPEMRSWFITDMIGQAVSEDPAAIHQGLATLKGVLVTDTKFRNHVDACLAKVEPPRPIDERVRDVLDTFEIHSAQVTSREKKEVLVWQLFARPVAGNGIEFNEWRERITSHRYFIDEMYEFSPRIKDKRVYDSCAFCKSDTHPEEQCPFPLVADWKGPIPKEVRAERAKRDEEAAAKGSGRTRGGGRGGRSRGNTARNGSTSAPRPRPY